MFYPFNLSVFYPHPGLTPFWKVAGAIFVLGGITTLALRWVRSYPYWAVGWFWYLISLLPVIGIVQVGSHGMADRYTYIPLIGAFIIISWSLDTAVLRWNRSKTGLLLLGCGMIIGCFAVSSTQIGYWRDYKTLFKHAGQVTEQNHIACNNLAVISYREGEVDEAIRYLKQAIEIKSDYRDAWLNLGVAYLSKKRHEEAVICFRNVVTLDPATVKNRVILAVALKYAGQADASADEFLQVLVRDPGHGEAHSYLGMIRSEQGRLGDAEAHLREALRVQPHSAEAHHNLGLVLAGRGRTNDALACFRQASVLAPGNPYIEKSLKRVQKGNPK
jgi:Flp pilus assembly protein TadD